jgi:hypothetical protein
VKVESAVFLLIGVFFLVADVVYWLWSREWAGTVCIFLSMCLALLIGGYLGFTARRIEPRPEDRLDADVEEGAGELGFFSPSSFWPILVAGCAVALAVSFVIGVWLSLLAAGGLLLSLAGLLFENFVDQT